MVLTSPEMAGRTEREIYQRITALGSMCISVCYTSVSVSYTHLDVYKRQLWLRAYLLRACS